MNNITLSCKINISFPKRNYVSTVCKALLLLLSLPYMCAPQHANCNLRDVFLPFPVVGMSLSCIGVNILQFLSNFLAKRLRKLQ